MTPLYYRLTVGWLDARSARKGRLYAGRANGDRIIAHRVTVLATRQNDRAKRHQGLVYAER